MVLYCIQPISLVLVRAVLEVLQQWLDKLTEAKHMHTVFLNF